MTRPACPRCARTMHAVGDAIFECRHDDQPRLHPDLPRERRCDRCGDRHTLPGPCTAEPMRHDRRVLSAPWGGMVPLPRRPVGAKQPTRGRR